jgi:hypothetical protein
MDDDVLSNMLNKEERMRMFEKKGGIEKTMCL